MVGLNLVKRAGKRDRCAGANCPSTEEPLLQLLSQEERFVSQIFEMGIARASHLRGVDLSSGTNREAKSIWKTSQSLRQVETNVGSG